MQRSGAREVSGIFSFPLMLTNFDLLARVLLDVMFLGTQLLHEHAILHGHFFSLLGKFQ